MRRSSVIDTSCNARGGARRVRLPLRVDDDALATEAASGPRRSRRLAASGERGAGDEAQPLHEEDDRILRYRPGSAAVYVEPVRELPVADAAHLRQTARAEHEPREGVVVGPVLPGLEMVRKRERGAAPPVGRLERAPQAPVSLVLDPRGRLAHLVREEVVVHGDRVERVAGERDLEQRDVPDPELAAGPGSERRGLARVVPEAAFREHAIEDRQIALQARRPAADDLVRAERKPHARVEEEAVELVELAVPVGGAPVPHAAGERRAEVPDVVRADLVTLAVGGCDLPQRAARVELPAGLPEADVGPSLAVARRVVSHPLGPVEQVGAADEEGEVGVRTTGDGTPVAPEPRAAGAVERDDDELRGTGRARRGEGSAPRVGRPRRRAGPRGVVRAKAAQPEDPRPAGDRDEHPEPPVHAAIVRAGGSAAVRRGYLRDEHVHALDGVVAEAVEVPLCAQRLHVARRISGSAAELVLARLGFPGVAPAAPRELRHGLAEGHLVPALAAVRAHLNALDRPPARPGPPLEEARA